jgi:hypothetical protein
MLDVIVFVGVAVKVGVKEGEIVGVLVKVGWLQTDSISIGWEPALIEKEKL